jgi:hypothetical protein
MTATAEEVAEASAWTIERVAEHLQRLRQDADEPGTIAAPPEVGPGDGVRGILELVEHVRAASTGNMPRPAPSRPSRPSRPSGPRRPGRQKGPNRPSQPSR